MKNNLKTIITCILVAAILITGINTGNPVTVNAAAQYKQLNDGATITLKPGDAKKFLVLNSDGKDISYQYRWSSSNPEIVGVDNDFFDDYNGQYVELTARSIGKATITGVGRGTGGDKQCRKVDYKYMYFTEYLITREDVNDFMAHRPEYTKANRFEDFVCKIYL